MSQPRLGVHVVGMAVTMCQALRLGWRHRHKNYIIFALKQVKTQIVVMKSGVRGSQEEEGLSD